MPPVGHDAEGHPESDSATVESDTHARLRAYAMGALLVRYAARPGFYVASDMGLLFERGNPAAVMAPDLLVSFGAGDRRRPSYKLWQEPVPDLVLELLSPKTWRRDVEAKPGLYEDLGVREFWLFDPLGRLPRAVNGWRLDAGGSYAPVPVLPDGGCRSAVLDLDLVAHGDGFRFRDPATGELLPDHAETAAARRGGGDGTRPGGSGHGGRRKRNGPGRQRHGTGRPRRGGRRRRAWRNWRPCWAKDARRGDPCGRPHDPCGRPHDPCGRPRTTLAVARTRRRVAAPGRGQARPPTGASQPAPNRPSAPLSAPRMAGRGRTEGPFNCGRGGSHSSGGIRSGSARRISDLAHGSGAMSLTPGALRGAMISRASPHRERLWYFAIVDNRTASPPHCAPARPRPAPAPPPSVASSLATRHANALVPTGCRRSANDAEGHPESDSATVESDTHARLRGVRDWVRCWSATRRARASYVASDMGLLFERGNPAAVMAPDLLVAFGAGDRRRPS